MVIEGAFSLDNYINGLKQTLQYPWETDRTCNGMQCDQLNEYNNTKALRGYEQIRDKEVRGIQWQLPPPPGWVRLNTDGATKVEDGVVGCGGIFRNENGVWMAGLSKFLSTTTYMAEIGSTSGLSRRLGVY
ncbi:hypothetical protein A2U01_0002466 [Trifolium medium]|uniref:Uncharacterized protein n=1 Tax=Trifolium medium TaxID=97028 RepID=A0A392M344_9FABA|nr:hypothetical protein [Trifolium medium]